MNVLFDVPNRNLSNTNFTSGLITINNITPVANCGGLLLRYNISNLAAGESLTLRYSLYKGGVLQVASSTTITESGSGSIGCDIDHKDPTVQIQVDVTVVGSVRVSYTLYSVTPGEDIV